MLKRSALVASCLLTLTVGASDGYNRYSPENVQRLVDLQRESRMVMATVPSEPTPANQTQVPSLWNRVGQRVAGADRGLLVAAGVCAVAAAVNESTVVRSIFAAGAVSCTAMAFKGKAPVRKP